MSRPLAPKGGNDRIYTPDTLAKSIVDFYQPEKVLLDPCMGLGAFASAMCEHSNHVDCYEIDEGTDFLRDHCFNGYNWIITNPPWSKFRAFLQKSMEVADNVVFLALLNAWFMKARMSDIERAGFGFKTALLVDTPPKPWPQTGFQLAAVHIQKGWKGPMTFSKL